VHELAAVAALVERLTEWLAEREPATVERLRIRRGSDFSEEALLQGFEVLSRGTPLAGARLEIEVAEVQATCVCGQAQTVTADDLIGHLLVCPACGALVDLPALAELEVLDLTLAPRHPEQPPASS
jgi:Zn finger protein HypA/HybF involved in hydrogenase expression